MNEKLYKRRNLWHRNFTIITLILSNCKICMPRVMSKTNPKLTFNTAIITYPSDYDGLLTLELIISKFNSIANVSTKIVVAREDPDEEIQRIHYHLYWDDDKRKTCTTEYFDIKLTKPVVVFIKENGNRDYKLYTEIASQLGIDNYQEMAPKLDSYFKRRRKGKLCQMGLSG